MSKIQSTLKSHFEKKRLVFWYDKGAELKAEYEQLELPNVTKILLDDNEFTLKHTLMKEKPDDKFLVYCESEQPKDEDNWLLDLLLANKVFYAGKTSLITSELGLDMSFKSTIESHMKFFKSEKRTQSLKALLLENETINSLLLKMVAVSINCDATPNAVVLRLQENTKHLETLEKLDLQLVLWNLLETNYGYLSNTISFEDFTYKLLQNHFYWGVDNSKTTLNREAMLFVQAWMDSKTYGKYYREKALHIAQTLNVESTVNDISYEKLIACDTYALCEQAIIVNIKNNLVQDSITNSSVRELIEAREHTFWYEDYTNLYKALLYASELLTSIRNDSFRMSGFDDAIEHYVKQWQGIDYSYRKFIFHSNKAESLHLLKDLITKIEDIYRNGFLREVNDKFQNFHNDYNSSKVMHQRSFFKQKVQPFIDKQDNVIVIISDALRYECGVELSSKLNAINRYTTTMEAMVCSLPSYTQLGMASLLPHQELELRDTNDIVYVDGKSSSGLVNRTKILQSHFQESIAISDEEFLGLNRDSGREFVKKNKVVFIYHDEIDSTGDKLSSEERVFDAVESSFETITRLITQAQAFNRSNIFVTADHGFLYQNQPTQESEFCKYEDVTKPIKMNRRFIIGKELESNNCTKKYSSSELNIKGTNDILLANSINKIRVQGGGNRFVHGSASLQEIVIPLISIHKKRSNDVSEVEVKVMSIPRITTNSINISLYQDKPVTQKLQALTLKVGFYSKSGELLTQTHTLTFDSDEDDSRNREKVVRFDFKQNINQYNNEAIVLVLKKVLSNSSEEPVYLETDAQLKLSFFNEF